ncbi:MULTISPECIES: Flp family type IVb pilin [Alcanivorax]|uniref:Flp family type IVb pilin n=1 Tax=Alcanivorax TaxID=59753 RepID=UPI0025BE9D22|nr:MULTISPECIES: Flp family type IVb pilin [Alcanivorax]MCK5919730.1 Flp family type IVb pilin [Methylococcales bacterium]
MRNGIQFSWQRQVTERLILHTANKYLCPLCKRQMMYVRIVYVTSFAKLEYFTGGSQKESLMSGGQVMKQLFMQFIKEEDGATMVEYAILVALISVVAIVAISVIGTETRTAFETVQGELESANGS